MGYNTRKISLSLSDLGVQLPGHHASRSSAAHRSPSASTTTTTTPAESSSTNNTTNPNATSNTHPPTKRVKRSHTLSSASSSSAAASAPSSSPSRPRKSSAANDRQAQNGRPTLENTPPPSPSEKPSGRLDYEGIKDDVVVAVLEQLESTGNRPHLIKELAAVLVNSLKTVESSANPTAIISSRLTNYLRRPWTALAPCPLAKEQVTMHPRRVYYYLTTTPRQTIPEYSDTPNSAKRIISPSISSGTDEEENTDKTNEDVRHRVSASPEVDLVAHEDLNQSQEMSDITFENYQDHDQTQDESRVDHSHNTRSASPPLEHDEREFSQTASVLERRKHNEQAEQQSASTSAAATPGIEIELDSPMPLDEEEESEEKAAMRNHEAAAALFGSVNAHHNQLLDVATDVHFGSSPMLKPELKDLPPLTLQTLSTNISKKPHVGLDNASNAGESDAYGSWNELKSPEHVELAELDDLLGGF